MSMDIPKLESGSVRIDMIHWLRQVIKLIGPGFHFETMGDEYVNGDGDRIFNDEVAQRLDRYLAIAATCLGRNYFEARCMREVWRSMGVRYDPAQGMLINSAV